MIALLYHTVVNIKKKKKNQVKLGYLLSHAYFRRGLVKLGIKPY